MAPMRAGRDDEDDHETFRCYRHPDHETALRCIDCERPICVDCVVQAPVGIKCPECARTSRAARGAVPATSLTRGLLAGLVAGVVLGAALAIISVPFFGLILAFLAGMAVGELTRRASGGYRDPVLARGAAVVAALGMLLLPLVWVVTAGVDARALAFPAIGAALAAYAAYSRAS